MSRVFVVVCVVVFWGVGFMPSSGFNKGTEEARASQKQGEDGLPQRWTDIQKISYRKPEILKLNEEDVPANEGEVFKQYAKIFHKVHVEQQEKNQKSKESAVLRGMHAKDHGCLKGILEVNEDVAPEFRQGIFAVPKKQFAVTARLSNGSGLIEKDGERDLRGLALKVALEKRDVTEAGPMARLNGRGETQDFLLTNAPVHHARDIMELMGYVFAQRPEGGKLSGPTFLASHPRLTVTLLGQTGRTVLSVLDESYWSRAAFRMGPSLAVKFLTSPCKAPRSQKDAAGTHAKVPGANYLGKDLQVRASSEETCFTLRAQPQRNPRTEPIEDHAVEWKTESVPLATLRFGQVCRVEIGSIKICQSKVSATGCDSRKFAITKRPLTEVALCQVSVLKRNELQVCPVKSAPYQGSIFEIHRA